MDALCYGDVIALDGGGCYLQAEGHRDARLWVRDVSAAGAVPADYPECAVATVACVGKKGGGRSRFHSM